MAREPAGRRLLRRTITIPAVIGGFAVVLSLWPLLLAVALLADLSRRSGRRSWSTVRLAAFLLTFLGTETLGLMLLAWTFLTTRDARRIARTYRVQALYTRLHFRCVRAIFSLRFEVEGEDLVSTGPMLVLVRHASVIDVLVPGVFVANPHGINLRYVLKAELLIDPCLDLAGNWLPNHFVRRDGRDSALEIAAVAALKAGLGPREGVLIFPEGTRFTEQRRARALEGPLKAQAQQLVHLLPMKPGGVSALLEAAPACDVVILGHSGLEGFARLPDIWRGALVGTTVRVKIWREPAASIPASEVDRQVWLQQLWTRLDRWLQEVA